MLRRAPRPHLTLAILGWAVVDVLGLVALSSGAMYLARGHALFLPRFPTTTGEAVACAVIGLALMLWAAARILREVLKQAPRMNAEMAASVPPSDPEGRGRP